MHLDINKKYKNKILLNISLGAFLKNDNAGIFKIHV